MRGTGMKRLGKRTDGGGGAIPCVHWNGGGGGDRTGHALEALAAHATDVAIERV